MTNTRVRYRTLAADVKYPINFMQSNRRFCLSLHNNGDSYF